MKQTLLSRSLWSNYCLVMKYNSTACIGGGGQPPVRIAAQKTLNNKKLNPWQTNRPGRLGSIPFLYGSTILDMNNLIGSVRGWGDEITLRTPKARVEGGEKDDKITGKTFNS